MLTKAPSKTIRNLASANADLAQATTSDGNAGKDTACAWQSRSGG
ncbi:hypothetical protein [Synechococcus sp. PCC 7335]|nr:hypothetical protein [Synechococcus sp. PCC 7335]